MTAEFNYQRAWRELAGPAYEKLSPYVKELYACIAKHGHEWNQDKSLDVPFPDAVVRSRFEALDDRELAVAAQTIYFWGHWAHQGDVHVFYTGTRLVSRLATPQQRKELKDRWDVYFSVEEYGSHRKALSAAQEYTEANRRPAFDIDWGITSMHNGPNNTEDCGASWKFSNFADQILRERLGLPKDMPARGRVWRVDNGMLNCWQGRGNDGWSNDHVGWATGEMLAKAKALLTEYESTAGDFVGRLRDHLVGDDPDRDWFFKKFMDHKEGTSYANDELPALFQPLVEGVFDVQSVVHVNHDPHPFVITHKHLENSEGVYLDPDAAMCGHDARYNPCRLAYSEHKSECLLFVQLTRNLTNAEGNEALLKIKPLMEEHKITGVAFVAHPEGYAFQPDDADGGSAD